MILDMIKGDQLPKMGLCATLDDTEYKETLLLFEPTEEETYHWDTRTSFWGADCNEVKLGDKPAFTLTPTRIIILLLIAAIHEEI